MCNRHRASSSVGKVNRELLLEKERIDLRRDEVLASGGSGRPPRRRISRRNVVCEDAVAPRRKQFAENFNEMEHRIFRLRGDLASIGEVDQAFMKEAEDTATRHAFLVKESEDLNKAVADLSALMHELNEKIKSEFDKSLSKINEEFAKFFALMFDGGSAKLKVLKPKVERMAEDEDEDGWRKASGGARDEEPSRRRTSSTRKRTAAWTSRSNCRARRPRRSICSPAASGRSSASLRFLRWCPSVRRRSSCSTRSTRRSTSATPAASARCSRISQAHAVHRRHA